jgi:hypothetical protein
MRPLVSYSLYIERVFKCNRSCGELRDDWIHRVEAYEPFIRATSAGEVSGRRDDCPEGDEDRGRPAVLF